MRLLFGHRIFEINAVVNPGERNEELELLCTERGLGNV
jgi:head-tail adaptor